jgi:hypothetical protein
MMDFTFSVHDDPSFGAHVVRGAIEKALRKNVQLVSLVHAGRTWYFMVGFTERMLQRLLSEPQGIIMLPWQSKSTWQHGYIVRFADPNENQATPSNA